MAETTLQDRARAMRQVGTRAERRLWAALRNRAVGAKFRRQHLIPPYIADFACMELALVVEVDGGQHGEARDALRDAALRRAGWQVVRVWNNEVNENLDGVMQKIAAAIAERRGAIASPSPLARGSG